jgi:ubiquitin-like-conjugating enzyme ATG3
MAAALNLVREYLTPVLARSGFEERGVLTPEEFVRAGDELVAKCPTWQWAAGDKALAVCGCGRVAPSRRSCERVHSPAGRAYALARERRRPTCRPRSST